MDIEQWFLRIPPITRIYISLAFLTTLGCHLQFFTKFDLFFNWSLIYQSGQYWRLLSTFLYFGQFSLDFVFQIHFVLMYCQALEEDFYRGRRADFVYFLLFCVMGTLGLAILINDTSRIPFLSQALTFSMSYMWSRKNPQVRVSLFVLMGFSALVRSEIPYTDLMGFLIGHLYYYLSDVFPNLPQSNGYKPLATPDWFKNLIEF